MHTAAQVRPSTEVRAARPARTRASAWTTSPSTAARSAVRSCAGTSRPFTPSATRSMSPPAAAATTGTPEANASCAAWQNVSSLPGLTKTSSDACARESSAPDRKPVNTASGSERSSARREGPSPTISSRVPGSPCSARRSSIRFSGASRPTYPTSTVSSSTPMLRRHARSRCQGAKPWTSTPRGHRCTRSIWCARKSAAAARDGARVRAAKSWMWRTQRQDSDTAPGTP